MAMQIIEDSLTGDAIIALLQTHLTTMRSITPIESAHALDLDGLRQPDISFWSLWDGDDLVGCGALREMDPQTGEIKSMHTVEAQRGKGAGALMLIHILEEAKRRGYHRLYLETGSFDAFIPARRLYEKYGFLECPPFGDYQLDPNSTYMRLDLMSD